MSQTDQMVINSPLGKLKLSASEVGLQRIEFAPNARVKQPKPSAAADHLKKTAKQLDSYFAGKIKKFDLAFDIQGTDFQLTVWKSLSKIKFGTTRSYSWQGEVIGRPKAVRAIGSANGKNPLPIVIPCHRVLNKSGALGGYTGGLHIKRFLLNLEGVPN